MIAAASATPIQPDGANEEAAMQHAAAGPRTLEGPQGYDLGRSAIDALEQVKVAPVPLNYELWVQALCRPDSDLARKLRALVQAQTPISAALSERLAAEHLPHHRKAVLIDEASSVIDVELQQMATALGAARESTAGYAGVLRLAGTALPTARSAEELGMIRDELLAATERSEAQILALEARLDTSATELNRLWSALEKASAEARTDPLTGLWNRKAFDERLGALIEQVATAGGRLGLAIIDIDHFKRVNDTWGHQTGDQVLRFVASEISRSAQSPRFCVRYGGEEFAILFPGEGRRAIHDALEKIRATIWERQLRRRSTGEQLGQLSVSAGYAELQPAETADSLIARADRALYAAKREGRNRTLASAEDAA